MGNQIFVTRPSMPEFDEYVNEIQDIWESRWMTNMGKKHNELEEKLKKYLGVENLSLFVNGHMSLELGLQAMNLNGEVITTPFTFASTTHAIVRNGLTPVFCDIDSKNFTMDVNRLEELITDRTCAIVPVHVYGTVCDVEEIERIAKKYGIKVIYDAAHAFGVSYKGVGIGNFGDLSMFSFHATKVFNTIEGGAVCYHNEEMKDRLFRLRDFGIKDEEVIDGVGANGKMNEFQAAMGLCNLRHVDDNIRKRKELVFKYRECLENVDGIYILPEQKYVESNYAYFPIVVDEKKFGISRNELLLVLKDNDIFARKYFYPITNSLDCFHGVFDLSKTPVALHISKRVLTLPLYADLTLEDVERISRIICRSKR